MKKLLLVSPLLLLASCGGNVYNTKFEAKQACVKDRELITYNDHGHHCYWDKRVGAYTMRVADDEYRFYHVRGEAPAPEPPAPAPPPRPTTYNNCVNNNCNLP